MKSYMQKKEDVKRNWWIIDAKDYVLGRMATVIANKLSGRDKVTYTPHVDGGDFVIVINAEKVQVTGNKEEQKIYRKHSGYYGHMKETPLKTMRAKHPERVIYHAVKGMLPKNKLASRMLKRLKIYKGENHPHQAQKPQILTINGGNK